MKQFLFLGLLLSLRLSSTGAETAVSPVLAGYTGKVSYAPGEEVTLHVSTNAASFKAEVFRYGLQPQRVWEQSEIVGKESPVPEDASSKGCRWPLSAAVKIPSDWRSGYYEVKLSAGAAKAYNNWGGFSLYAYNGRGGNQGHRVSFLRPPGSQFGRWEQPFVDWAERQGIALEFAANSDLEFHPEILSKYKLVLSVGHDEYWSAPMRDNLEKFIGDGGNVAFFSGNTCCWQVRSEEAGSELTCWKQNYPSDPVYGARAGYATLSSLWSHHLVKRPENQLTGVGFLWGGYHKSHGQFMDGSGAFTVHRPDHWIFEGTQLKRGDSFGAKDTIVGYECDGCELEWRDGLPFATHRDGTPKTFEVLGSAPAKWHPDDCQWYDQWENGRQGNAVLGTYVRGGTVFTCGSTDWSHGLAGGDPIVERVTRNVIEKLSK